MKKKVWKTPEIIMISSVEAKTHAAAHENNYSSIATPNGHKFFLKTPHHSTFASGIKATVHQYLS